MSDTPAASNNEKIQRRIVGVLIVVVLSLVAANWFAWQTEPPEITPKPDSKAFTTPDAKAYDLDHVADGLFGPGRFNTSVNIEGFFTWLAAAEAAAREKGDTARCHEFAEHIRRTRMSLEDMNRRIIQRNDKHLEETFRASLYTNAFNASQAIRQGHGFYCPKLFKRQY